MAITAIVDTTTNEFESSGHLEDARYVKVTLTRNPDPSTEKWDGATGFTAKSAGEIAAYQTAKLDAAADAQLQRAILAAVATMFKSQTGAFPNAAQRSALRNDFIAVWKQLG